MAMIAKTIVGGQRWLITDGVKKIGNIEANSSSGYSVKIGDNINYFSSTKSIENGFQIVFQQAEQTRTLKSPFAHWPIDGKAHNNIYDVRRKIHLYTKTEKSKCYYAAGYFNFNINGQWQTLFAPKYIFVQRYPFNGPYKTIEDATDK